jgi:hypothetical protein
MYHHYITKQGPKILTETLFISSMITVITFQRAILLGNR